MSSKKIFAASLAAILATGSVAAVALADAPADNAAANDEYTVVIDGLGAGKEVVDTAKLSVKTYYWSESFKANAAAVTAAAGDMSKLGFSKIDAGIWEAYENFKITETSGAKLSVWVNGKAQEYSNNQMVEKVTNQGVESYVPVETVGYLPKLKDGAQLVVEATFADPDTPAANDNVEITGVLKNGKVTALGTPIEIAKLETGDTMTQKGLWDKVKALDEDSLATLCLTSGAYNSGLTTAGAEKADVIDVQAKDENKELGSSWKDATNKPTGANWVTDPTTGTGKTLGPVTLEPKFEGLGSALRLTEVLGASFGFEAEITVDGATYDNYVKDKYSVDNAPGSWNANQWNASSGSFVDGTNFGLGLVANSCVAQTAVAGGNGGFDGSISTADGATKGWTAGVLEDKLTKEPALTTKKLDLYLAGMRDAMGNAQPGRLNLSYYGIVNPNVLKNLNNGGTVTFTLDKDLDRATLFGSVKYFGADGWHIIDADDSYEISGNEITFEFPAGLTYHGDLLDQWHAFSMEWDLDVRDNNFGAGSGLWTNPGDADPSSEFDGKIVKMTFKANAEAPVDDDPTSDPSTDDPSTDDPATSDPSTDDPATSDPTINNGDESNGGDANNSGDAANSGVSGKPGNDNPNTGVALAIAPVVLAAGAVATVVAKKRK